MFALEPGVLTLGRDVSVRWKRSCLCWRKRPCIYMEKEGVFALDKDLFALKNGARLRWTFQKRGRVGVK